MYSTSFCHADRLLDIRWHGAFTADGVAHYALDLKQRFVREGFRPGYLLRIDMQACGAQPGAAIAAFRLHFASFPKARRIAIIVAREATRDQVLAEMRQTYLQIFDDADEGLAWLLQRDVDFS